MKKYKFIRNGDCVPGLPHEISDEDIAQFNEEQMSVWNAALASGLYVEITDTKPVRISTKSKRVAAALSSPTEGDALSSSKGE